MTATLIYYIIVFYILLYYTIIVQSSWRGILLVCNKVVSFTRGSEALLIDSAGHHDLPLVDDGAEHGPGSLHGRQLSPLRLLVVVHKHLVEGFAAEMLKGAFFSVRRTAKERAQPGRPIARMCTLLCPY